MRQRLREWNSDRSDKRGNKRLEIGGSTCFVPLWLWIQEKWDAQERRMALAKAATTLGYRPAAYGSRSQ